MKANDDKVTPSDLYLRCGGGWLALHFNGRGCSGRGGKADAFLIMTGWV